MLKSKLQKLRKELITINELVLLKNGEAVCDSLEVADKFHKRHVDVIRSLENLTTQNCTVKSMFHASNYKADNGQTYKKYFMNRDGFSLLVMGFTGKEALEWKLKYIKAFNEMEKFILEKQSKEWITTRYQGKLTRKNETDTIKKLIEYAKNQGSEHADKLYITYSKLANKTAGVTNRNEATIPQLNNLSLIENIILHVIDSGIMTDKHYKEIYQDCKKQLETFKELAYLEYTA